MRSAITISLVPESKGGPFVFQGDLEIACTRASEIGFDAVEIFPPSGEAMNPRLLRQVLHRNRLRLAAMGTGAGWVVRQLSLTHADGAIRRQAQEFIASLIDFAGAFNAPAIIGSMQGRADGSVTREQALGWLGEALEQLGPRAHAQGVPLLFEPLNRYESNLLNTVGQALKFLQTLRTRNIRLLCDLFHMNIEESSIEAAFNVAGSMVGHVHFADSNRRAVGWGHTPVVAAIDSLRAIGYRGYLSGEVYPLPSPEEAARKTMESFRGLFPSG